MELRDRYNVPEERARWEAFQVRDWAELDRLNESQRATWMRLMREATMTGRHVQRVRVVSEPPSDYIRFELALNPGNADAGEDIRYLPRHVADDLDLPSEDYWLFDRRRLALMRFDDDDALVSTELIDDPGTVARYSEGRDTAWAVATPFAEYVKKWRGAERP
ncbi:hypothetical protein P3X83_40040 [Spongiactinospora sp. TRM90649]|nr:DUF6879 family protein [Spongiactinospora sp. TRM90649]MDF5758815.1 hypothetical protein [Spongiactinospora sp. TRM90649]